MRKMIVLVAMVAALVVPAVPAAADGSCTVTAKLNFVTKADGKHAKAVSVYTCTVPHVLMETRAALYRWSGTTWALVGLAVKMRPLGKPAVTSIQVSYTSSSVCHSGDWFLTQATGFTNYNPLHSASHSSTDTIQKQCP